MGVVTDMGGNVEDEREPTWDEAVAMLEAATPVEVTRPLRKVTVIYRYADGIFTATSPDVTGLRITGPNLHQTRLLVRQDLGRFLDPSVQVAERFPAAAPETCTAATGRGWLKAEKLPGIIVLSSSGTARTFISSARRSLRRVRSS